MGNGDFTSDVWIFHWKAQDYAEEDHRQLSIGDRLKLGSLEVPVVASPSTGVAPQLAVCTVVRSGTSLHMPRSSWFAAWVAHHFSGMQKDAGQLFLYAPDLEQKKSAIMLEINSTDKMIVIDLLDIRSALRTAWAEQRQGLREPMSTRDRDHVVQLFSLQDCLYRAKAAGIPWLFQADADEVLNFGRHSSMAGVLAWADQQQHDAITFGSFLHSVTHCVGPSLAANGSLGSADKWHYRFPCQMSRMDCSDPSTNTYVNTMLRRADMDNDCLGPRGRRKFLVQSSSTESLEVHTPLAWRAHHMGHALGDAVVQHYQGLLMHGRDLCTGYSRPSRCQLEWCQAWSNEAVCEAE